MEFGIDGTAELLRKARHCLHQRLINSVEVEQPWMNDRDELDKRILRLLERLQDETGKQFSPDHRRLLCRQVADEVTGFGPLAELMADSSITDILVNGASNIWVDRGGLLQKTDHSFDDEAHVRRFVDRFVAFQGKQLDSNNPTVDARLPDGSRMHVVIPPLSQGGTVISIRRFQTSHSSLHDLVVVGMLSPPMAEFLSLVVKGGVNLVIAGGAGAGKTTLLNAMSEAIPAQERIITIEESAELALRHPHVVTLESRQGNSEGVGRVDLRNLLRNALRMRADRIIVGEVRGEEVFDMLQAMNVGHDGSLTTVHANNPQQVLKRLETLALLADGRASRAAIQNMINGAVQIIVQVARMSDGRRRVTSICEVVERSDRSEVIELFRLSRRQPSSSAAVADNGYEHVHCERRPECLATIQAKEYALTAELKELWHITEPDR
ncbi:CpaF family protein [Marinobacter sp. SS21]|uniref:CpaF family protein n=1 Tax=Marinobacter sp. SS21 TaxID=2979460 RepID=UPI00232DC336|nr:CpaF family protein [Marinobacter sp. SS21]MDC0662279.1 CpaF family protein [Marinobacter sp. SS21]